MRILFAFLFLVCSQTFLAQTPSEIPVSLKTLDGKFIGQVSGGGLEAAATTVTPKQIFVLIDLNGGKIVDGDKIKLKFEASQWHEDQEKSLIHRVPIKGAKEGECIFKLRLKDKLIFFETPGGKFIKIEENAIITTNEAQKATLFDVQAVQPPTPTVNYTVAFKFKNDNYLGMVANGGMDASSKEITPKQVFQMVDLNGGSLKNGDSIKLIFEQSQLREDPENNKIHRVPLRAVKEEECIFKILVVGQNVLLQTPSGQYLALAADGKSLTTSDKKDDSSLLTAVPNPQPTGK